MCLVGPGPCSLLTLCLSSAAPPHFLETPPRVLDVRELEPMALRCVARGNPQPQVTWMLGGRNLGQGHGPVQVRLALGRWARLP